MIWLHWSTVPKLPKPPETFDEWIATVIKSQMVKRAVRQEDLAARTGIALTLVGRSLRGTRPLSVQEFETMAGVLNADPAQLLKDALDGFGGMEKLLAEVPVSEPEHTVAEHDNVTYLGRVTPPAQAAADENPRVPPKE